MTIEDTNLSMQADKQYIVKISTSRLYHDLPKVEFESACGELRESVLLNQQIREIMLGQFERFAIMKLSESGMQLLPVEESLYYAAKDFAENEKRKAQEDSGETAGALPHEV
jgi:hypothetical protein